MRKGGNGDGVSQTGDAGMDDDALAAAMESHFAPFAAAGRSVSVPVPHDDPRADAELDDDEDPEVTAITRRFDRTHDTLGAMDALEQLLVERTGQIPVVTPELLAAHAARLEKTGSEAEAPAPAAPESEPAEEPQPAAPASVIDWSITTPAPLDPAPGFSSWIDPEAIAAAIDTTPAEFTDVSTKVFAVFSADRSTVEQAAPVPIEPEAAAEPETEPEIEAPAAAPRHDDDDELDGIDDLAAPAPEPIVAPVVNEPIAAPLPSAQPEAVAAQAPPAADAGIEPESAPQPEEGKRKRRFWPFGRR